VIALSVLALLADASLFSAELSESAQKLL